MKIISDYDEYADVLYLRREGAKVKICDHFSKTMDIVFCLDENDDIVGIDFISVLDYAPHWNTFIFENSINHSLKDALRAEIPADFLVWLDLYFRNLNHCYGDYKTKYNKEEAWKINYLE